jgi:phosphate transport system permease protein
MYNVVGSEQGGLVHALIGTLLITFAATLISVPIGVLCAIYLVEYGGRGRLARTVTFLVDVMTGIPSIVAGLFALAVFVLVFGPAFRAGIGGSVALSLLMIPTVVRSSEEMFRLVPDDLREASYALGVPKWLTICRVVLPTAIGGVVTGIVLAISRVVGETAPLLVVAGSVDGVNTDLFHDRMTTIPVFIYEQYSESTPTGYQNAWGGALVLLTVVVVLNLAARIIGRLLTPAERR